ncbi:8145_t:CDS:1, partial [Funneliformis geosporum]
GENLDLSEYLNLETLIIDGKCLKTHLKKIKISNCKQLIELSCPNNDLKKLDLSNNCKLEKLDISNNKFSQQNLSFLSHLVNLKELKLGNSNSREKGKSRDKNYFTGDLEPLKNMNKLELLSIRNTEISGSLKSLENMNKLKILDLAHTILVKEEADFFIKKK